jgi:hypothetical protein
MLRLPSVQDQYEDYWSGDPALVQPPQHPGEKASPEDIAKWESAIREHADKIRRARQTGDWSDLIRPGETPTKFVMRQVDGEQWRYLLDESAREDEHQMGQAKFWHYMFRCAVVSVKNLGKTVNEKQVKDKRHPALGLIAPADIPNLLDQIDGSIVTELAQVAYVKARGLDPL